MPGRWVKKMEGMKEVLMVVTLGMDPAHPSVMYAGKPAEACTKRATKGALAAGE